MLLNKKSRFWLVCLTLSLCSSLLQAAWSFGNTPSRSQPATTTDSSCGIGSTPTNAPGRFSPVAFNTQRNNFPPNRNNFNSYQQSPYARQGQYQARPQYQGRQPHQQTNRAPQLSVRLNKKTPYLQETVIYTLRVVTSGNVKTLTPEPPSIEGVAVQKLTEQTTQTRTGGGQHEFVTEYSYALTPLQAGDITIPPATVRGTYTSSNTFELHSWETPLMQVQPADPSVQPWLPLESLAIQAQLDAGQVPQVGKPLSLTVTLSATGLAGSQLPSLESGLASVGFKVYQEKSETSSRLSQVGGALEGQRIERYTLVPQHNGVLQTAEVRIPWWNVMTHSQAWAVLPAQTVHVTGAAAGGWLSRAAPTQLVVDFWQVLAGAVGAMVAYWVWLWLRARGVLRRARHASAAMLAPAWAQVRDAGARMGGRFLLAPYRRLRHRLAMMMPLAFKVRYCLRRIDCEEEPGEWAQLFQLFIAKFVDLPASTPVSKITEALIERNATPRPAQLLGLMQELDAALYGPEDLDFKAWKRSLRSLIRPRIFSLRRKQTNRPDSALPALNPGAS